MDAGSNISSIIKCRGVGWYKRTAEKRREVCYVDSASGAWMGGRMEKIGNNERSEVSSISIIKSLQAKVCIVLYCCTRVS